MNYHPLLVHFPIAFWTLYSLCELIPIKKLQERSEWFYIKAILVIAGTLASILTYFSGLAISELYYSEVMVLHSRFAIFTIFIYTLISLHYLLSLIEKEFYPKIKNTALFVKISNLEKFIFPNILVSLLSLIGLISVTITGGLGGIVAFGPGVDPITNFIGNLFFGNK